MSRSDVRAAPRALLIGATGALGRQVLAAARRDGLAVRAFARDPNALAGVEGGEDVTQGDARDRVALERALEGCDRVISALGNSRITLKPVTLLSDATTALVAAMRAQGVRRLVCVTGMGAGDSRGHGGFFYDRLMLPLVLREIYKDKDRQEAVVRGSGLDWTLVRPAFLTNAPGRGRWREILRFEGERMTKIARADVATYLVREALAPRHSGLAVNLTY